MLEKLMAKLGYIPKEKVATEIARIYNRDKGEPCTKEQFNRICMVQSALNLLCRRLDIKPKHRNKLGGGTGEMLGKEKGE